VKQPKIVLLNRKIGQPDTHLPSSSTPHPIFCGQNPLDTQNPSSYTPTVKKQYLIKSKNKTTLSKIAIIDIDNTLWQFSDHFYLELRKINSNFPTPDQWFTFDTWKGYCSEVDFIAAINSIHHNQDSDRHKPYPESRGFLSSLKEHGFHIILASHRVPEMRQPTERWLNHHRLPYDELHLSLDKTVLFPMAEVVVDDAPPTLEKAIKIGALGAGLLFPWNRAYADNGFGLFQNLNEVLDYILKSSSKCHKEIGTLI
jgi:hypothetical protein